MFLRSEILREFAEAARIPIRGSIDVTHKEYEGDNREGEWRERFELAEHVMDHEH